MGVARKLHSVFAGVIATACQQAPPASPDVAARVACPRTDVAGILARLDRESSAPPPELVSRPTNEALERARGILGTAIRTADPRIEKLYANLARREAEHAYGPSHPAVLALFAEYQKELRRCQVDDICGAFEDRGIVPSLEAADLRFEDATRAALQGRTEEANRLATLAEEEGQLLLKDLPVQRGELDYRIGMLYLHELEEPTFASQAFARANASIQELFAARDLYADEVRLLGKVEIGVLRTAMAVSPRNSLAIAKRGVDSLSHRAGGLDADASAARDFIYGAARGCDFSRHRRVSPSVALDDILEGSYAVSRRAACGVTPTRDEVAVLLTAYASSIDRPRQSYDVAGWDSVGSLLRNAVVSLALQNDALSTGTQALEVVALTALNGPTRLLSVAPNRPSMSRAVRQEIACAYRDLAGRALRDLEETPELSSETTSLWGYTAAVERRIDGELAEELGKLASESIESELRAHLPEGAALVSYVVYQPYSFSPADAGAPWLAPRYAAIVLDRTAPVRIVPIPEPASVIDSKIQALRADIRSGGTPRMKELSRDVYDMVLRPVLQNVQPRRLYIVPAGAIEVTPFLALHDGEDFLLNRDMRVVMLGSALGLARSPNTSASRELRILADPAYGTSNRSRSSSRLCPVPKQLKELRGTRVEADAIAATWKGNVRLFTGAAASEAALDEGAAPAVLHIATHALLGGAAGPAARDGASSFWQRQRGASFASLFCSRIALAGANEGGPRPTNDNDDGWLSAIEARFLPLEGTRLVVLSACDTGASAGTISEGSFGLKSAFLAAGAHSVLSTLWPIESDGAARYMEILYRYFVRGYDKVDAVYEAGRAFATHPEWTSLGPSIWAAFVLTGDPGPLLD